MKLFYSFYIIIIPYIAFSQSLTQTIDQQINAERVGQVG